MELLRYHVSPNVDIFLAGDEHQFCNSHYGKGIAKMLDDFESESADGIKPKDKRIVLHGDMIEAIPLDDKRWDEENCKESSIFMQVARGGDIYKPINKRIVTCLDGNHTRSLKRLSPRMPVGKIIADSLGAHYGGFSCKITYVKKNGDVAFRQFATHGRTSINSRLPDPMLAYAAKQRALKNALREKAGDCAVMSMGHTHQLIDLDPFDRLYIRNNADDTDIEQDYITTDFAAPWIHPDQRFYCNTGSFFCSQVIGLTTYSEEASYDPLPLGYYKLQIRDYKPVKLVRVLV
jgi:hypothetical protein